MTLIEHEARVGLPRMWSIRNAPAPGGEAS